MQLNFSDLDNRLTVQGTTVETDVVLVWRFANGRLSEVWDIPCVYAGARQSTAPNTVAE